MTGGRRSVALVAAVFGLAWSGTVAAGGFEHPANGTRALGRGGAFVAGACDLSALEHNPAGLLLTPGTHVMLSNNFTDFRLRFSATAADGARLPGEENRAGPFLLAPVLGASTDLAHPRVRIAAGVYGPSAYGRSSFDPRGSQRYMLTDTDITLVNYTVAVAWQPFDIWGLGLSLHWVDMLRARMGLVVSGWMDDIDFAPEDGSYDVRSTLDVADHFNFAMTIGTWVRPLDRLRLGASFRLGLDEDGVNSIDASGTINLRFEGDFIQSLYESGLTTGEGIVPYDDDGNQVSRIPVTFSMVLPMVARLGVQYIHPLNDREALFDLEADVVWEGWSALRSYAVDLSGYMQVTGKGVVEAEKMSFRPVDIRKAFRDTWSVRLGGDVRIVEWLQARLGGYWESGAMPLAYTNVDFASFDRFGLGTGLTFHWRWFDLSFGYSHIFQQDRIVPRDAAAVHVQFPLLDDEPLERHKVNAGKYQTSFDIYSVSLEAKF